MGLCKLIVIVGVAALFMESSNSASIGGQDNVCVCTREYVPVCASNGITYSNKCEFECEKRKLNDLEIMFDGDCDEQPANEELCMCTREYFPLCATDGKTYSNECMLKCAQKTNSALKFSSFGECDEISHLPMDQEIPEVQNFNIPCACTKDYRPVCGSDGNTYSNKCMLNCAKFESNKNLEMVSMGECSKVSNLPMDEAVPEVQNFITPCMCFRNFDPVCGSDGKTYSNECMLNCAKFETNKNLEMVSKGECVEVSNLPMDEAIPQVQNLPMDEAVPEVQNFLATCMCTQNYVPVCGSDGKTYSNECMLNCAKIETHENLKMVSMGECVKVSNLPMDDEMCACPRIYWPVCATNGKTYSNKCLFECAQKTNKQLELLAEGECN